MGSKTKIDWCDSTWNPVTGCLHGCEYCYARKIAERFGSKQKPESIERSVLNAPMRCTDLYSYMRMAGISQGKVQPYPFDFSPTFHRYKLDEPKSWKKSRNVFVCSMADLFGDWVPDEWIREVFDACEKAPWHRYIFLTKNPSRYNQLYKLNLPYINGAYFGFTITGAMGEEWWRKNNPATCKSGCFISIEPLQSPLQKIDIEKATMCGWIIIGAETGNRKDKVVPRKEWIDEIVNAASQAGTPVFMKESLRELMGPDFRQEFPWKGVTQDA